MCEAQSSNSRTKKKKRKVSGIDYFILGVLATEGVCCYRRWGGVLWPVREGESSSLESLLELSVPA
jgi:hypothetical protein